MEAYFYNFGKRNRSTGRPSRDRGTLIDINIKDGCDILNPLISFNYEGVPPFNYLEIPLFNRYYFINSSSWDLGLWNISCKEDVGASLKNDILNTRANILYADSPQNLIDSRIPTTGDVIIQDSAVTDFIQSGNNIILGITGKGSFGHYVLDMYSHFNMLLDGVDMVTNTWQSVLDAFKQTAYGGNAAENIKKCFWFPIIMSGTRVDETRPQFGNAEDLVLGAYPCKTTGGAPIQGYPINTPMMKWTCNVSIPWAYNDWRRNAPYTKVVLYLPLMGVQEIANNDLVNSEYLTINYIANVFTGELAYEVITDTGRILTTGNNNIAIDMLYGTSGIDAMKAITSGATLIGSASALLAGAVTGGAAAGAGSMLAGAAANLIDAYGGQSQGSAGMSGGAVTALNMDVHCWTITRQLVSEPNTYADVMGYPFMKCDTVGNHSGYIQCDGAEVHSDIYTNEEVKEANNLLNGGVYIE